MEILIVGAVIVALMVYVSTRIKKESKRAYERETVNSQWFRITKPDEFLIPVGEDSPFIFEAQSRDFGSDDVRDQYQCRATVREKDGFAEAKTFEMQKEVNNTRFDVFHKIIYSSAANKNFELEICVLPEFREKYQPAISEMLESFSAKQ